MIPQTFRKLPQLIPSRKTITHPTKREVLENHQRCQTTKRICDRSLEGSCFACSLRIKSQFFQVFGLRPKRHMFFLISLCVAVQDKRLRLVAETYWGKGSGNFVFKDFTRLPGETFPKKQMMVVSYANFASGWVLTRSSLFCFTKGAYEIEI